MLKLLGQSSRHVRGGLVLIYIQRNPEMGLTSRGFPSRIARCEQSHSPSTGSKSCRGVVASGVSKQVGPQGAEFSRIVLRESTSSNPFPRQGAQVNNGHFQHPPHCFKIEPPELIWLSEQDTTGCRRKTGSIGRPFVCNSGQLALPTLHFRGLQWERTASEGPVWRDAPETDGPIAGARARGGVTFLVEMLQRLLAQSWALEFQERET